MRKPAGLSRFLYRPQLLSNVFVNSFNPVIDIIPVFSTGAFARQGQQGHIFVVLNTSQETWRYHCIFYHFLKWNVASRWQLILWMKRTRLSGIVDRIIRCRCPDINASRVCIKMCHMLMNYDPNVLIKSYNWHMFKAWEYYWVNSQF